LHAFVIRAYNNSKKFCRFGSGAKSHKTIFSLIYRKIGVGFVCANIGVIFNKKVLIDLVLADSDKRCCYCEIEKNVVELRILGAYAGK
jgi:hypothetical protein